MRPNRTKAKLLRGEVSFGIFILAADPHVTGVIAASGFDFVHFDMEHTSMSLGRLEMLVRTADSLGITPMVRVPGSAKRDILTALEAGAQGIMVPTVESAAEAAAVVDAARYYPEGRRGMYYLGYGSEYGRLTPAEHYASSNRELLIAIQIETVAGVEQAEAIAAVPGVDCLFVGPADLSQSLGTPGDLDTPEFRAALQATVAAALGHGKIAGALPLTLEIARPWVEMGVRYLAWGPDMTILRRALVGEAATLAERTGWKPGA